MLWQELINEYDLPAKALVKDMMGGFKLNGWLPASSSFARQLRRLGYSGATVVVLTDGMNKSTLEAHSKRQDELLENATWVDSTEERAGWIWPCQDPSLEGKAVARRFGLKQKEKIRMIDDCSCRGFNLNAGVTERFALLAIDKVAVMLPYATSLQGNQLSSMLRSYL